MIGAIDILARVFMSISGSLDMSPPDDDLKKYRDLVIDIHSKAYDRAAGYTNLIMLGGYAGGFAIWNFTREHLPAKASIWVAFFLLASVTAFILFEIYKMVFNTRHTTNIAKILRQQKPIADQIADIQEYEKKISSDSLLVFMREWVVALLFSVSTALTAGAILIWNFVAILRAVS